MERVIELQDQLEAARRQSNFYISVAEELGRRKNKVEETAKELMDENTELQDIILSLHSIIETGIRNTDPDYISGKEAEAFMKAKRLYNEWLEQYMEGRL